MSAAPKCRTRLQGALTEQQQEQMEDMQAELYRLREDSWDDRYRSMP